MPIERRDGYLLWVGGPVPKGSAGITIGKLIMVRTGHEQSDYLIRHEFVHVGQWARLGAFGFLTRYFGAYVVGRVRRHGHRGAYLRIPLEVEADWNARRQILAVDSGQGSEAARRR
jgi:hypothetical protein